MDRVLWGVVAVPVPFVEVGVDARGRPAGGTFSLETRPCAADSGLLGVADICYLLGCTEKNKCIYRILLNVVLLLLGMRLLLSQSECNNPYVR